VGPVGQNRKERRTDDHPEALAVFRGASSLLDAGGFAEGGQIYVE
jgi:hypothetical protein